MSVSSVKNQLVNKHGFTLIELIIVIVVMGILAAVAVQNGGQLFETARIEETKQELDGLARAIGGNPELVNNGVRVDFGYVGDVGSFPPNLDALYTNPGSYATWNGPYISNRFSQVTDDYKRDAFGTAYTYSGGPSITSTGSGSSIIRRVANSTDDFLLNGVTGNIYDLDGTPPGTIYDDSVSISLTFPNGMGGTITKSLSPDQGGYFAFDSVPIGNHDLMIAYEPNGDTLRRFVSVTPGSSVHADYRLASDVWYASYAIPGLVGHYTLNEDSGLVAYDISGAAYNADLLNDATGAGWSTGKVGGAFLFDGTDDYFETALSDTDLQISSDYSISLWMEADANQVTWAALVCKCTPTGNDNHWTLQWDNNSGTSKRLTVYHPNGSNWRSSYTLADAAGAWHHIVITFRASPARVQLYVDSVLHSESTSLTQAAGTGNGKLRIGRDRAIYSWRGKIDDVRIYNLVLSPSDVQALYNLGN